MRVYGVDISINPTVVPFCYQSFFSVGLFSRGIVIWEG